MDATRTWPSVWQVVASAFLLLAVSTTPYAEAAKPPSKAAAGGQRVDLIVVPEEAPWFAALAAPAAARLASRGEAPLVIALAGPRDEPVAGFLDTIPKKRRLALMPDEDALEVCDAHVLCGAQFITGHDPLAASAAVAARFWGRPKQLVLAPLHDPAAAILAATYAAHTAQPLVLYRVEDEDGALAETLAKLAPEQITVVVSHAMTGLELPQNIKARAVLFDRKKVSRSVLDAIGRANVQNVILAREPNSENDSTRTAWLAPYHSLVRKAPVVLCQTEDGTAVEKQTMEFIAQEKLWPRFITILAPYVGVGTIPVRDEETLGEYEVEIEPCSGSNLKRAASFAVGRIPFDTMHHASLLLARGRIKERLLEERETRALMIANPNAAYGPLPLCETVSMATAEEIKNCRIDIDTFYGKSPTTEQDIARFEEAGLILFEGHIFDMVLFHESIPEDAIDEGTDGGGQDGNDDEKQDNDGKDRDRNQGKVFVTGTGRAYPAMPLPPAPPNVYARYAYVPAAPPPDDGTTVLVPNNDPNTTLPLPILLPEVLPFETAAPEPENPVPPEQGGLDENVAPVRPARQLKALPLVILQSCHSLEEKWSPRALTLGGAGLLGTTTNVHSASGSSFVKAYLDSLLYSGETQGGALRDARNYFLCLGKLRAARGHKQQAKAYRVGLSFRLWGDPEVPVLPPRRRHPKREPVRARAEQGVIRITIPDRMLPDVRTQKYHARLFPGSQVAGIVKSVKNKEQRHLMPLYYFPLSSNALPLKEGTRLTHAGDKTVRVVHLLDEIGRRAYVLYFPAGVKKGETHEIRVAQ